MAGAVNADGRRAATSGRIRGAALIVDCATLPAGGSKLRALPSSETFASARADKDSAWRAAHRADEVYPRSWRRTPSKPPPLPGPPRGQPAPSLRYGAVRGSISPSCRAMASTAELASPVRSPDPERQASSALMLLTACSRQRRATQAYRRARAPRAWVATTPVIVIEGRPGSARRGRSPTNRGLIGASASSTPVPMVACAGVAVTHGDAHVVSWQCRRAAG